jgi:AbrB family looped-hinge helix DNA binding protein
MATVAVSVKGQVVLPAEIRRKLGIVPGTRVEIELAADGTAATIRPVIRGRPSKVEDGVGMVANRVGFIPLEEMDGARILARYGGKRPL